MILECVAIAEAAGLKRGKKGKEEYFVCPLHPDNSPSLRINAKEDVWYCDPCQKGGKAWALAAAIVGVDSSNKPAVTAWLRDHNLLPESQSGIIATYDYVDENGGVLRRVQRTALKAFPQCRPDGNGDWIPNVKGVRRIPYRLPELLKAEYVFVVEGEKDVDALFGLGLCATCNDGGAEKWSADHARYFNPQQRVTIIPDNDDPGRKHAEAVARSLYGKVASLKILDLAGLPDKGDVSDWLQGREPVEANEELCRLAEAAAEWKPASQMGARSESTSLLKQIADFDEDFAIQAEAYSFLSPCPPDHFLTRWIDSASKRTDAAHEYHEAAGLVLLASATPNVRARLRPYPRGLPTNLYVLLIGDSTISRKTTSANLARDAQNYAILNSLCPDQFSPEGLVEHLASRPADSSSAYVDEFGELLGKLHHAKYMAGLRGLFLTLYEGNDYTYRRHSKRAKGGAKIEDVDCIKRPHLSILAATTPAVFDILLEQDIACGLIPRFGIVMPKDKPARQPFYETGEDDEAKQQALIKQLRQLHSWSMLKPRSVKFLPGVLDHIDGFAVEIERTCRDPRTNENAKTMQQRLTTAAVKLAMIIAAGHPGIPDKDQLEVTMEDARGAIAIGNRWQGDALRFADRIGESQFERKLASCFRLVKARQMVRRGIIAQTIHVDARTLDAIRDTLLDREMITLITPKTEGRSGELWTAAKGGE